MADSEKSVSAKDPLRISASTWNQLMEMLRWYNREGRKVKGSAMTDLLKTNTEIYVQNLTGLSWDTAYKVVRLSNSLIPLDNDSRERVNKDPILGAFVPLSEVDAIGITQKPSESAPSNGLIVPTVIHGVTIARVKMLDEGHTWANPVSGVIDYLESSAECGQARILYHVADGSESLAIVNLIGAGPCDVTVDSGESGGTGSRSDGLGWIAGLCANNCLKMRVMEIHGLCAGIDLDQVIPLEGDGTTWTGVCEFEYCNSTPGSDEGSNDCRDTGIVTFTKDASIGLPKATIDEIPLYYHRAANGWVEFAGGGELCGGCPEPTEESGPCGPIDATGGNCCGPNGGCGSNYFVVRFECAEVCVIDGWDCPAWYCVTTDPECCEGSGAGTPQPMFVDGDGATDPSLHICSGPYDTEEEALAVCPSPVDPVVCSEEVPPVPGILYAHFSNCTGDYAALDGQTLILTYDPDVQCSLDTYCWFASFQTGPSCWFYINGICDAGFSLLMGNGFATSEPDRFNAGAFGHSYTNPPFSMSFSRSGSVFGCAGLSSGAFDVLIDENP